MRNLAEFNEAHKNQPVFIIGAGPSLHSENPKQLNEHLTIAVNSGICFYPEATYFVSDDEACWHWSYMNKDLMSSNTIVLLYDKKLGHTAKKFGNRAVLFKHREGWYPSDTYSHTEYRNHIGQCRNSLVTAIMIAHIMGCSPIFLLGADCCRIRGNRYFWQFWEKEKQPYRNDKVPEDRYMKTKDSDTDLVDLLKYWNRFGNEINKKCKVYNVSPISKINAFPRINSISEALIKAREKP